MPGAFYRPKPLQNLSDADLAAYRRECDDKLRSIQSDLDHLEGRFTELDKDFASDGVINIGGVVITTIGIGITAIATVGGALALIGGAVSLISVSRYGTRFIERNLVSDDLRSRRESIEFYGRELSRIEEELSLRGVP